MKRLWLPWLGQNRRLTKEYGPQRESEEARISIAMTRLMTKRLGSTSSLLDSSSNEEKGFF